MFSALNTSDEKAASKTPETVGGVDEEEGNAAAADDDDGHSDFTDYDTDDKETVLLPAKEPKGRDTGLRLRQAKPVDDG